MPEGWEAVAQLLRDRRKAQGLSKRAAAKRAGFSEGTWRMLEVGHRQVAAGMTVPPNPTDENLEAAARALAIDPERIFVMVGREYDKRARLERDLQWAQARADEYREEIEAEGEDATEQLVVLFEHYQQQVALARRKLELLDAPPNPIKRIRENQRTGGLPAGYEEDVRRIERSLRPAALSGIDLEDLTDAERDELDAALARIRKSQSERRR